jgi:protein-S-isoprenylcysteine O-methyltransferase Ste14
MDDRSTRDGASVRFPPPLVPLIALVVGLGLQAFLVRIPIGVSGALRFASAGVVGGAGLALIASALRLFQASGQDPKPWEATPEIIATGIYAYTRNPMYLGMGLLQAGIGIGLANGWIVALVPVSWLVIQGIAIRHEEAYLTRKFGSAYVDYKASVRRWL